MCVPCQSTHFYISLTRMTLTSLRYTPTDGWSASFPDHDGPHTLVLVFGASAYVDDPAPLETLRAAFPSATVVGCSTAGEILGTEVTDHALAVTVVQFEHTRLAVATSAVPAPDHSWMAGQKIAEKLRAPDLRGVLVFSDGSFVNGSALVQGLNVMLPPDVVITGGLAGDGDRFERTWVYSNGSVSEHCVVGVGLYGDRVEIGYGSEGGWDAFGDEHVISRSKDNVLFELDGIPALDAYKQTLGKRAAQLPASALLFPLAMRSNRVADGQTVRTALSVSEADASVTFAGDMPEGATVQFMRADLDALVDGAGTAGRATAAHLTDGDAPTLLLAVSCVGRRLLLEDRSGDELAATLAAFPEGTHQIGFYSYGELAPYGAARCDLHNQTMTLTAIREV